MSSSLSLNSWFSSLSLQISCCCYHTRNSKSFCFNLTESMFDSFWEIAKGSRVSRIDTSSFEISRSLCITLFTLLTKLLRPTNTASSLAVVLGFTHRTSTLMFVSWITEGPDCSSPACETTKSPSPMLIANPSLAAVELGSLLNLQCKRLRACKQSVAIAYVQGVRLRVYVRGSTNQSVAMAYVTGCTYAV